jgi:ubiquinone/menaquinone biosynthesis C-methylase UbiE
MIALTTVALKDRLIQLFRQLDIESAHFAACMPRDWEGLLAHNPEFVASLILICPMGINLQALGSTPPRLLVVTGDQGRAAMDAQRDIKKIPGARAFCLRDYFSPPWADPAADRRQEIEKAMIDFIDSVDRRATNKPVEYREGSGEIAEITYSVRGAGKPLILMPLALSPSQWDPLVGALSEKFLTITLGGPHLGMVAHLETRSQSSYMRIIDQLINELELSPGQSVLEAGCGPGAIVRRLAKCTDGNIRIVGADVNRYLLREAAALVRRDDLHGIVKLQIGDAVNLPFAENQFDATIACTLLEEGDANRMLAEFVRVTKPGGKVGALVRSVDLPRWVNLALNVELKRKVESPVLLGGNVHDQGCADASLYRRMHQAGLVNVSMLPQWASHHDGERLQYLHDRIVSLLEPVELSEWRKAVVGAEAEKTFFIAEPFHCAVGTKP